MICRRSIDENDCGFSVAGAGDVNGDRIDDLNIGANSESYVVRLFRRLRAAPFRCESVRDSQGGSVLTLCLRGRHGGSEMGKPLSMDLRGRALAAVDAGMSRRASAGRFGVSVSSVIRWDAQRRATGSFEPKPQGGDTRSRRIEARHADVMAGFEEARDQSLEELRVRLAERSIAASSSTLSRFFQRHGITRKKRPDMRSSRTGPTS